MSSQVKFRDEDKIAAFNVIAEHYFENNFGTMSKSDFEVLLFSIYLEQILKGKPNPTAYSDYTLSKQLGITQSKVNNLKIKKQLQYPRKTFDWRLAFEMDMENASYDKGCIFINISDINVYLEVKNAIEENGGYIEVQLNRNLLKVKIQYFLDLIVAINPEEKREDVRKAIRAELQEKHKDISYIEGESFGKKLGTFAVDKTIDVVSSVLSGLIMKSPTLGKIISISSNIIKTITQGE